MPTSEEIDAQVADVTAELQKLLDVYAKELLAKFDKLARVAMHAIELARLVGQTDFEFIPGAEAEELKAAAARVRGLVEEVDG